MCIPPRMPSYAKIDTFLTAMLNMSVANSTQVPRAPVSAEKKTSSPAQRISKARPIMDIIKQSLLAGGEAVFNHRFAVINFISEHFQRPGKVPHYSAHYKGSLAMAASKTPYQDLMQALRSSETGKNKANDT